MPQTTREQDDLSYALAKQVPDMERGFAISTRYGDLPIDGDDAVQVAALVERLLRKKLRRIDSVKQG
ncbi:MULTISPECIES: hypothetical protein [Paraburkholderia]|uniref:hypothetical protein n=1 Tax=Paraburkholderia TaxID=1822464 RepID=UPI00036749B5|nr:MULTISPECIES: hypothetical protein [Paraburkholderia]MDH6146090.1 hypothetical protein [Paraburkholderia sp. WSM4179]